MLCGGAHAPQHTRGTPVPTLTIIDGMKIQMFYHDHGPPHLHARTGGEEVLLSISDLDVIWGSLSPARLQRLLAWAREHQAELALNWLRCQDDRPLV